MGRIVLAETPPQRNDVHERLEQVQISARHIRDLENRAHSEK